MSTKENNYIQHTFIIGSKSIGQYGGYETFVDKLLEQHKNDPSIKYHVACKANGDGAMDESKLSGIEVTKRNAAGEVEEFTYHNAHVFKIKCPKIGPAVAIYYDNAAVHYALEYCQKNNIKHPIFYILTCRIGLYIDSLARKIHAIGGYYLLNPDGHEWARAKWPFLVKKYWKWSEKKMVNKADVVVCDSIHIEEYIKETYHHSDTTYIAYGSDTVPSMIRSRDPRFTRWLRNNRLRPGKYYLVVGRFVPENNYETMIREFMASDTTKDFALITNVNKKFLNQLESRLSWKKDKRIKFVGTVYDHELLKKIRENAYGYFHGHEVGGTNPSLLEAMESTNLLLLLDVGFNREVAQDAALYWTKQPGDLSSLINHADDMSKAERETFGQAAKDRIKTAYQWGFIADKYKALWQRFSES